MQILMTGTMVEPVLVMTEFQVETFDDPERLMDVSEAAALLHVKGKTLYAWVSRNQIPYRKIRSLVRFHRGELIEWAKAKNNQATSRRRLSTVVK